MPSQITFQQGSPQPVVLAGNGTVNVGVNNVCWATIARHRERGPRQRYAFTWLLMDTRKMTSSTLKTRAKNLRNAVERMLHVSVTHSQALELVAKEENFPTWDAACASFKASSTADAALRYADDPTDLSIRQMLEPSSSLGALIIVWGVTGQGKTPTARAIVEYLLEQPTDNPKAILHVGVMEFSYPETAEVRYVPESESILRTGRLTEELVVVDDLRSPHTTFEVLAMVLAGAKVIVTLHAKSPLDRLHALLQEQGMGEELLERLLKNGQILTITARR